MILLREYNFMKIKPYFTKNRQFYENKLRKNNCEISLTQNSVFYVCACAHGLSLWLRDSSTCGAVPERSEGMSREDGEVRIARRWRRSETKPTPEAPEIYSVLRWPAVLFLTIWHCSAKNGVLRKY